MPRFASREEYEAWKSGQAAGSAAADVATPAPAPLAPAIEPAPDEKKKKSTFSGLPGWSWVFIVACFAIPIVSMGGAIPGALGFGAAAGCANVAKREDWEPMPKVLACLGIAGGAWIAFLAFAAFVASRR